MSQQNESGVVSFTAGEALERYRLVKLGASRTVTYADAGDTAHAVTQDVAANAAEVACKLLLNSQGTFKVTAAGVIAANTDVEPADDGKVTDSGSGTDILRTLEAASADGGVVEAVRIA